MSIDLELSSLIFIERFLQLNLRVSEHNCNAESPAESWELVAKVDLPDHSADSNIRILNLASIATETYTRMHI